MYHVLREVVDGYLCRRWTSRLAPDVSAGMTTIIGTACFAR
jgi:hypothetical protein